MTGPTLKQLLAAGRTSRRAERRRGRQPDDGHAARAGDLFPSGSATVNPAYDETLQRLTKALNKVPGRVLVVGHTDDQPVRSLRYQDNFELSRDRAVSVVTVLQPGHRQSGQTELDRRRLFAAALHSRVRSGEPRAQPARGDHPCPWNLT